MTGSRRLSVRLLLSVCALGLVFHMAGLQALAQTAPTADEAADQGPALPIPELRSGDGELIKPEAAKRDVPPSDVAYAAFQRGYYLTALELAKPLANLGDPAAQTLLGEIYERGLAVPQNLEEAARWYKSAAEAGYPEAQFRYALMLLEGIAVTRDAERAREMMKQAAEAGLPMAEFNYAQLLVEASPASGFHEAVSYFRSAAEAGIADAQYALAQLYSVGQGVEKDEVEARKWLRSAALARFDIAEIEYGIWLINGRGGPARMDEGFRFLLRAARKGNAIAVNRVAHLFKDGLGTAPDVVEAAKWAVIAKRVGNSDPVLDDFFRGLNPDQQKAALEAANRFQRS